MVRLSFWLATIAWCSVAQAWTAPQRSTIPARPPMRAPSHRRRRSALFASAAAAAEPRLVLFNSQTRSKEPFRTRVPGKASMYTCGPTVYDAAHLGNFRAFLTYDLIKRVLSRALGYDVTHICNLTDVDDKIINRANDLGLGHVSELTRKYERQFMDDLAALNVVPATRYPRATEHIDDMMAMIRELAAKGLAYETLDGSWYFNTQNQAGYGEQLVQNMHVEDALDEDRNDDSVKKNPKDFCLWKAFKEGTDRDDMAWEDLETQPAMRKGRPGWHLECSAMSRRFLGDETIDLHGGGIDLKFPHHENEIAQSEGVSGNKFCNCWLHNGFVNIGEGEGDKMSKSLGNFLTLRGACTTPVQVRAYRYLVISSQYRNPLSFSQNVLKAAVKSIKRIDNIRDQMEEALKEYTPSAAEESSIATQSVPQTMDNFRTAILDDLSMPRASASLFALVKKAEFEFKRVANTEGAELDIAGVQAIWDAMNEMDQIFGIFYDVPAVEGEEEEEEVDTAIPDEVAQLVVDRTQAKDSKDWELADSLRARITELGFAVKDVKGGDPIVSRLE